MGKKIEFTDLHHHSENSLLDGLGSIEEHVCRCCDLGHQAIAITEHGTCRSFAALERMCEKHKIRPVFGNEVYVTRDHQRRALTEEQIAAVTHGLKGRERTAAKNQLMIDEGIKERRHLVLLAGNDEGLRNLLQLSSLANTQGFYYKPRIDLPLLAQHNEGIWVNSGCLGSVLAQSWMSKDMDRFYDDLEFFVDTFGNRFSLEIQPHPIKEQVAWNAFLVKLAAEWEIPLVAANDSHYPSPDNWELHDTLVCVSTKSRLTDCDRLKYVAETFGLKSGEGMIEAFKRTNPELPVSVIEDAVERAAEISDNCRAKLWKPSGVLLPSTGSKWEPDTELRKLCVKGLRKRGFTKNKEYIERLCHELSVIADLGFDNYFLVVHEMVAWAESKDILVGPGRGSAAGSLVCYLLGITAIDPIPHNLLFERFLTPGRPDWPDIDIDFEVDRRVEIFEHLKDKYGEDHVAQISTFSRLKGRSALKDVARVHGIGNERVNALTGNIIDDVARKDGDKGGTLEAAVEATPALQEFEAAHPDVIDQAIDLEGHLRGVGVHAAGVIVSPIPLGDFVPLEFRKMSSRETVVVAYDMRDCERMGLIKLDVLGLKTLSCIADTRRLIERRHGKKFDLEKIPLDDEDTLASFTAHDFAGVFQFDTGSARGACKGVQFDTFDDVVAMNALNRPGPATSGLADTWRERKKKGKWEKGHPIIERICADTFGVIVYQEHIIRILQELAGYTPEEAGKLRKAISKSQGVGTLADERPVFVERARKHGDMPESDAEALWTAIEQFGAYGFNKSHAAAYSLLSYQQQWLKLNYPAEFFCGLLIHEDDTEKGNKYLREAGRRGIRVQPPSVNDSRDIWGVSGRALRTGLLQIKGVGPKAAESIVSSQPFNDFPDFIAKINRRTVNKGVIRVLLKSGALSEFFPNLKWGLQNYEQILAKVKNKNWSAKTNEALAASAKLSDFDAEDAWCMRLSVGVAGTKHPLGAIESMLQNDLRKGFRSIAKMRDGSWIAGVITSCKDGNSAGTAEKYAKIEVEDKSGKVVTLRLDDAAHKKYIKIIGNAVGRLVGVNVTVSSRGTVRPLAMVDLLDLRERVLLDDIYDDDTLLRDVHPLGSVNPGPDWYRNSDQGVLVQSVETKVDRNGRKMAFVTVDCGYGDSKRVVVFSSVFAKSKRLLKEGRIVTMRAKKGERGGLQAMAFSKAGI